VILPLSSCLSDAPVGQIPTGAENFCGICRKMLDFPYGLA
jgi:hypothetical protein